MSSETITVTVPGLGKIRIPEKDKDQVGQIVQRIQSNDPQMRMLVEVMAMFRDQFETISNTHTDSLTRLLKSIEQIDITPKVNVAAPNVKMAAPQMPTPKIPPIKVPAPIVNIPKMDAPIVNIESQPVPKKVHADNFTRNSKQRIDSCDFTVLEWNK